MGNALVITTATLIIGFLALATSSFSLNADMGLLTAVVIAVALAAVFLLLPPLLLKIEEKGRAASTGARGTNTFAARQRGRRISTASGSSHCRGDSPAGHGFDASG